ncbi:bifunctional folylpolyglutamate synthase/dihydrofolate synthase [Candidatus Woesearchaeota archaeon]|nr:bifunctional folylpolyglutamate synthase/dihydrofolate synthase [Candidatus Woesearchaeota archaeon]
MDYEGMLGYLYNIDAEKKWNFGLERTEKLLEKIGNPHLKLKVIHVTGTNGKGSVCAMISSIMGRKYSVGMFTSPHLVSFNERFAINQKEASNDEILEVFNKVRPHITDQTFFEIITCMAFLLFSEKNVDYAVMEVGLGGRLDATNVSMPIVSVITMVDYEHTNILGTTLEEITTEKCGIIKPNTGVVTGARNNIVLDIIKKTAELRGSKVIVADKNYRTNLLGDYQEINAGIAVEAVKATGLIFSERDIKDALMNVILKGRLYYRGNVLFDVAHNPSGVSCLVDYLKKNEKRHIVAVFGVLNDKDWKSMADKLVECADYLVLTTPQNQRALEPKIVSDYIGSRIRHRVENEPLAAFDAAKKIAGKDSLILVTGSFYLVGSLL